MGSSKSWLTQVWLLLFNLLGLVLLASFIWCLIRPLLPLLIVVGAVVTVLIVWRRWRWR